MMLSLFDDEISDVPARRKPRCVDRMHPAPVGSGPEGRTCRDCASRVQVHGYDRVYQRCGRMIGQWERGSDIGADAACAEFVAGGGDG